jgi:hypothetical protein
MNQHRTPAALALGEQSFLDQRVTHRRVVLLVDRAAQPFAERLSQTGVGDGGAVPRDEVEKGFAERLVVRRHRRSW